MQDVDWPIRFVENVITSRKTFSPRTVGVYGEVFGEVDLPFSTTEKVGSLVKFVPLCLHGQHLQARF